MDRRGFVSTSVGALGGITARQLGGSADRRLPAAAFHLRYAPHIGMFAQHAGADVVAQLEFMAAEGFTAFEDNGMKGRPVADQERMGQALSRLKMSMGVLVAHTIGWREPNLTSGDAAARARFLTEVRIWRVRCSSGGKGWSRGSSSGISLAWRPGPGGAWWCSKYGATSSHPDGTRCGY